MLDLQGKNEMNFTRERVVTQKAKKQFTVSS